jgi:hypothetical protein
MYASISTPQSLLIKQQVALSSIGFLPSSLATHYDMNCTNTSFLPLFAFIYPGFVISQSQHAAQSPADGGV